MYKEFKIIPRTDFENVPTMELLLLWEEGFEGNNFEDSPFTGFYNEEGELFMYPEVDVEDEDKMPVVAWAEIPKLKKK